VTARRQAEPGVASEFVELFEAQRDRMVALARMLLGSRPAAEEVVQDAFIRVLGRWASIDHPEAYLRVAVVNACRTERRRAKVLARKLPRLRPDDHTTDHPTELMDVISTLPERQRIVVALRYYEDLSEQAIADILGCTPGAVKSLLHRALPRLRNALDHGSTQPMARETS
jgi:RNA polymerase sigma-70 factor (sigma-E family)